MWIYFEPYIYILSWKVNKSRTCVITDITDSLSVGTRLERYLARVEKLGRFSIEASSWGPLEVLSMARTPLSFCFRNYLQGRQTGSCKYLAKERPSHSYILILSVSTVSYVMSRQKASFIGLWTLNNHLVVPWLKMETRSELIRGVTSAIKMRRLLINRRHFHVFGSSFCLLIVREN